LNATAQPRVLFGSPAGDRVAIRVLRRLYPSASDYWDGNWLDTPLDVTLGRFKANIDAHIRADELESFRMRLERLHECLCGEALLESMEEWIRLRVTINRVGQLHLTGVVSDAPGARNKLEFSIENLDQSHLPPMLDDLRSVAAAFPVVGHPPLARPYAQPPPLFENPPWSSGRSVATRPMIRVADFLEWRERSAFRGDRVRA